MSYKINYIVFEDHLKIEIEGTGNKQNFASISKDIRELSKKYGLNNILIDARKLNGRMSVFDTIDHIDSFPPEMRFKRYAVIDRPEYKQINEFYENAAVNRGFSIYYFYNVTDAVNALSLNNISEPKLMLKRVY